jgi:hypothetical protein
MNPVLGAIGLKEARMPVFTAINGIWSLTFVVGGVIKRSNIRGEFYE